MNESPQCVEECIVFGLKLLDGHNVGAVLHLALATQHIHRELVGGVAGEELPRFDERIVDGGLAVFRVAVLDEEIVDGLGDLGGAVEPTDSHHQVVPLAPLELGDEADVEGLVGPLTLDEDAVARLVLYVVVVAAVAHILPGSVLPGLSLTWFALPCSWSRGPLHTTYSQLRGKILIN